MKDNHRKERAKRLISGQKSSTPTTMEKKSKGKVSGLSGAAPTSFPAKGLSPVPRMDKRKRLATGGVADESPKKKSAKTEVNIIIASGKGDQAPPQAMPVPVPAGAGMAPPPQRPMPPQGGPGMPPPGMGMKPPGAMKRGGGVKKGYPIDDGAGGGEGRLEKAAAYKSTRKPKDHDDED